VAHLRAPEGCPWDREQTHESLRPYLLEEAYEVLSALDAGDDAALAEELGDLLLQVVLHAQLAVEAGTFSLADVVGHITAKLVRRHPHVFGDVTADTPEAVRANWEALKRAERGERGEDDPLAGLPRALPALARAQAVRRKLDPAGIAAAGLAPLATALGALDEVPADPAEREARLGEALWALVALAERWGVDAETALRAATGAVEAAARAPARATR
jgi:tetrapyrrole methylase family protein/MazG family protein